MYTPRSFREDDVATLHDVIRANPFGLLVSAEGGRIVGTHLPFVIESSEPHGVLIGHVARANPQWKTWTAETEVMAVFNGPHSYISPGWYEQRVTVPTWNYAVVHAYGRPRLITDAGELEQEVRRLTAGYEPTTGDWHMHEAEPVMETALRAIVGFRIPIDRIEGKFKFNQNRSEADRRRVAAVLEQSADPGHRKVSEIMSDQIRRAATPPEGGSGEAGG